MTQLVADRSAIRTRICAQLEISCRIIRTEDLPESQRQRGDYWRFIGTRISDPARLREALSLNCSRHEAGAMFGAMTILLNPSRDTTERAEARLKAFSLRLSDYPRIVVAAVLEHWAETRKWQPAWAELKSLLDATAGEMEALAR